MAGHQESLRSIGQGFAGAVDTAVIGRNQAVLIGKAGGNRQAGYSRRGCQSGRDEFTARHACSLPGPPWLVIIPRTPFRKPARQTITMWTTTKRTRKIVTKK